MDRLTDETLLAQVPLRHSVRSYTDRRIEGETLEALQGFIAGCNDASGLTLQLVVDEPDAFTGMMPRFGNFQNVRNYIACVGPKTDGLQEEVGYWGERCVLAAQALGLNSCWVALTYSKKKVKAQVPAGQKLALVISLGYGTTQGNPHKIKTFAEVAKVQGEAPSWFEEGVKAALLAPTAMNQQKFEISYDGKEVGFKSLGGSYSSVDLGIVRSHFDLVARCSGRP